MGNNQTSKTQPVKPNLSHNQINSKYTSFLTSKHNIVWAGALSLAWTELKQKFVKQDVKLDTNVDEILKSIQNLNHSRFTKNDISEVSVYIQSGYGQSTLDTINKEVKIKFPGKSFQDLIYKLHQTDIISYAYLFKKLSFEYKFEVRSKEQFQFNNKKVKSFYAKKKEQKRQIQYCNYQNKNNFVLRLANKSNQQYLFFVKTQKQLEIDFVIDYVIEAEKKNQFEQLQKIDNFQMPIIQLNCTRRFNSLQNLGFLNHSMSGYYLAVVIQSLKLNIDESGAKAENQAVIIATRGISSNQSEPKNFYLDSSFWIIMKEPKKHPYLCVYVQEPIDD